MELRPARAGREEAEFICSAENLPFSISVILPGVVHNNDWGASGAVDGWKITFDSRIVGTNAKQARKFLDAMGLLQPSGEIEILDLKEEKVFFTGKVSLDEDQPVKKAYRQFVNDIAQISDCFKVDLRIPAKFSDDELESILLLKTFASGGSLSLGNISATVVKSDANKDLLPRELASGGGFFRFVHPRQEPKPKLFGLAIDTGPVAIEVESKIANLESTLKTFRLAGIGDGVLISFEPVRPAKLSLVSDTEWLRQ